MAGSSGNKSKKRKQFELVHRLSAGIALLSFGVVLLAGILSEARVLTIVYRALGVIVLITIITRVVTQILATYEEIYSGKT